MNQRLPTLLLHLTSRQRPLHCHGYHQTPMEAVPSWATLWRPRTNSALAGLKSTRVYSRRPPSKSPTLRRTMSILTASSPRTRLAQASQVMNASLLQNTSSVSRAWPLVCVTFLLKVVLLSLFSGVLDTIFSLMQLYMILGRYLFQLEYTF